MASMADKLPRCLYSQIDGCLSRTNLLGAVELAPMFATKLAQERPETGVTRPQILDVLIAEDLGKVGVLRRTPP
jgi:hypothetical protein